MRFVTDVTTILLSDILEIYKLLQCNYQLVSNATKYVINNNIGNTTTLPAQLRYRRYTNSTITLPGGETTLPTHY